MRTRRWIRLEPGTRENTLALGVALGAAAGVAVVTFYLTRLFVSREEMLPLGARPAARGRGLGPAEGGAGGVVAPVPGRGRLTSGPEGERG